MREKITEERENFRGVAITMANRDPNIREEERRNALVTPKK